VPCGPRDCTHKKSCPSACNRSRFRLEWFCCSDGKPQRRARRGHPSTTKVWNPPSPNPPVGFHICRCSTAASRATTSHRGCRTCARWRTASSGTVVIGRAVAPAFLIGAVAFENRTGWEVDVGQRGMRSWLELHCRRGNRCRRWWSRCVSRACSSGDHRDGEQQYPPGPVFGCCCGLRSWVALRGCGGGVG